MPWNTGSKSGQLRVLGRNFNGLRGHSIPNRGSSKRKPRSCLGRVERIDQIERLGVVGERHDAVRETLRNVHHQSVFGGEFGAEPFAEGRGVRPQIDDGVIEGAADAAHHLDFRSRRQLIVHAAQRARFRTQGVVDLNESASARRPLRIRSGKRSARKSRGRRRAFRVRSCRRHEAALDETSRCGLSKIYCQRRSADSRPAAI